MFQRVDPAIGTVEFMPTDIRGINGFHILDLISSQCRFKAQHLVEHVMVPLV
jgi:hypothetical protein